MKLMKATLTATFTLLILLAGRSTFAESPAWSKANAAAEDARRRGDYPLAETYYKEAINLQVSKLGADSPEVAVSLNNLAVFYQDGSMYPKAEQAYLQALSILEKNEGQRASFAHTLNNLAALYHDENNDQKAETLYSCVLGIWQQLETKEPANEAATAAGLADIYRSWNRDTAAEPLYKQALTLWSEQGKSEGAEAADPLYQLGEIYHSRSDNADAESMYARALAIWEHAGQLKSTEAIAAQATLGEIYRAEGRYSEGEPLIEQAQTEFARALDFAFVWLDGARDEPQRRGLARTVTADETDALAGLEREGSVHQHLLLAEGDGDVVEADQRRHRARKDEGGAAQSSWAWIPCP